MFFLCSFIVLCLQEQCQHWPAKSIECFYIHLIELNRKFCGFVLEMMVTIL